MNDSANIQLGNTAMLWVAVVAVPCLLAFFVWVWRRKQAAMTLFIPSRLFEKLLVGYSPKREKLRYWMLGLAVFFGLLALAQPRWGYDWEEVRQKGLDVMVVVDTSRSMLAPDVAPTRLERAKLACIDLMRVAKTDRLGLVAFAGSAFLQCPLTFDDEAFRLSLGALDTSIIPQGGSSLAVAIKTAQESFKQDEDNHKVLILITDGEDHEEGAIEAAKAAAKAGIRIYTIGAGTPNGELLTFKDEKGRQDYIRDEEGNIVRSKLNEGLLREIATVADGFYLPLAGTKTMETLYEHPQGLGALPKSDTKAKFVRRYQERYQWPLAVALILLLIEWVLQTKPVPKDKAAVAQTKSGRVGVKVAATVAGVILLAGIAQAEPSQAQKDFEQGKYKAALEEYSRLAKERPDDARLPYNAGTAAYRAGEYETAVNKFNEALRTTDLDLQRNTYYNRGNALYQQGSTAAGASDKQKLWEASLEDYERALKLKKDDADAGYNRDVVKKKLEELKKQQQQQQQQNQQNQNNQKQDDKDKSKQDQKNQPQKQDSKSNDQKSKDQQQNNPQDQSQKKQGDKDKQQQTKKQDQPKDGKEKDKDKSQQEAKKQNQGDEDKKGDKQADQQASQQMMAKGNGEMTQQQVVQLLDLLKDQEKALIFRPPGDPQKAKPKGFKDW